MTNTKKLIFDADDTLWENNKFYVDTTDSFIDLCVEAGYERNLVINTFDDFELKVVNEKGYGSINFLYILENLFSHFDNTKKLNRNKFNFIIRNFKSQTINKPTIFSGVEETIRILYENYELYVLTKGNLKEQQNKIERSGLKHHFKQIFVVPEKNDETYLSILNENKWVQNECCMIGNSPKSDINPALRAGMYAIFIHYPYTWKLEDEELIKNHPKLYEVKEIVNLPKLLESLFKS
jgi:putative hydrolase of the HAD superfamily